VADDWLVTGTTVPPLFVITVVPVITFVVPTVAQASTLALMVVVVVLTEDLVGANPVVPPFCFSKLDFVGAVAPSPAVALLGFETGVLPLFQTLATRLLAAVAKNPNFEEGLDFGARPRTKTISNAYDSNDGVLTSWMKLRISYSSRFRSSSKNSSNGAPPLLSADF